MSTLAIELSFDPDSEARLMAAWAQLAVCYQKEGAGEVGMRPHVSLAIFRDGEPREPARLVDHLSRLSPFLLRLEEVAAFSSSEGVVYLRAERSPPLLRAHAECRRALGADAELIHPYYQEENWIPHCTLAVGVPSAQLDAVAAHCRGARVTGAVGVRRVSIVRYRPTSELCSAVLVGSPT